MLLAPHVAQTGICARRLHLNGWCGLERGVTLEVLAGLPCKQYEFVMVLIRKALWQCFQGPQESDYKAVHVRAAQISSCCSKMIVSCQLTV